MNRGHESETRIQHKHGDVTDPKKSRARGHDYINIKYKYMLIKTYNH